MTKGIQHVVDERTERIHTHRHPQNSSVWSSNLELTVRHAEDACGRRDGRAVTQKRVLAGPPHAPKYSPSQGRASRCRELLRPFSGPGAWRVRWGYLNSRLPQ